MNKEIILQGKNIFKSFFNGPNELQILKGLNINIYKGEALCIVGSSGAGKSTLLHILGTLDKPNKGEILYKGEDVFQWSNKRIASFRNICMGFVFQFHYLLPEFTALENVAIPCKIAGFSFKESKEYSKKILSGLGLENRLSHYPGELSGGEKQRVAIARAIIGKPDIIFADEPTGNLDFKNAEVIQDLFFSLWEKMKITLVVVTHNASFAEKFPRVLKLRDGEWVNDQFL